MQPQLTGQLQCSSSPAAVLDLESTAPCSRALDEVMAAAAESHLKPGWMGAAMMLTFSSPVLPGGPVGRPHWAC